MVTLFEYLYRDAGNFKAFGCIALEGELTPAEQNRARDYFDSEEFFIAEQIGVPPLYENLYLWSDGPVSSDHCWHEFLKFKVVDASDTPSHACRWGTAQQFIERLCSVAEWDGSLSPHFLLKA